MALGQGSTKPNHKACNGHARLSSLHVELVPFRIEHRHAVLAIVVRAGRNKDGASRGQTFDRLVDAGASLRGRRPTRAARVDVKVQTVLDRLGLRYALEVDARAVAFRIDDRTGVIPLFFRDTVLGLPGLPFGGRLRGSLQLVAEGIGPEPRHYRGARAIEDDLYRDGHAY